MQKNPFKPWSKKNNSILLRFKKKTIITHFISQNETPGPYGPKNRYAAAGDFYEHGLNGFFIVLLFLKKTEITSFLYN